KSAQLFFSQKGLYNAILFLVTVIFVPLTVHAQMPQEDVMMFDTASADIPDSVQTCETIANDEYHAGSLRYTGWLEAVTTCYRDGDLLHLLPPFLQTYDFSAGTADEDFAIANCLADVQREQYAGIQACIERRDTSPQEC